MNKSVLHQLNVIPEGMAPWLTYDQYLRLKKLFEVTPFPVDGDKTDRPAYLDLYDFLTEMAGVTLPCAEAAIHYNAFVLIRRGYQVETITPDEYDQLRHLMVDLEVPDPDDFDLYETGGHRALYNYLTQGLGLSVQAGRGPVWQRANDLRRRYEADQTGRD
jgi:hypothetical protein